MALHVHLSSMTLQIKNDLRSWKSQKRTVFTDRPPITWEYLRDHKIKEHTSSYHRCLSSINVGNCASCFFSLHYLGIFYVKSIKIDFATRWYFCIHCDISSVVALTILTFLFYFYVVERNCFLINFSLLYI